MRMISKATNKGRNGEQDMRAPALPFLSEYRAFGYSIGAVLILATDNMLNVSNLRMRMISKATNKGRNGEQDMRLPSCRSLTSYRAFGLF